MERDEEIKWILACCAKKDIDVCLTNCPLKAREGCIEEMADMALARIERLEEELSITAPAVRCQDCQWSYRVRGYKVKNMWRCGNPTISTAPNGYCHRGVRKEERNAID